MRKLSQKIIALVLALAMCASMLSVASASQEEDGMEELAVLAEQSSSEDLEPLAEESSQGDPDEGVDFFSEEEVFLKKDGSDTLEMNQQSEAESYFASLNEKVVSVNAESGEITGKGIGSTKVELRRSEDGKVLDSIMVYCFRPTTVSQDSGSRAAPKNMTTTNSAAPTRTYKLVCQQKHSPSDRPYKKYLSSHGCTVCAVSALCQAYGAADMTVDWFTGGGLEEIAVRDNGNLKDKTLGYYGLQKVLEYGGISSKVFNWGSNMEKGKTEMVKALSAGRPILMFIDQNSKWNGIGPLCSALHCVLFVGIDKDGYVQIINSSYPHKISRFKYGGSEHTVKLTVGEVLDHFIRHTNKGRSKTDDFWFTKSGGMHTFLEVTCDQATVPSRTSVENMASSLAQSTYVYSGEAFTPQVSISGLSEEQEFRVRYTDNVSAGTATATVVGLGDYCGIQRINYTINRASGKITASDKTVASQSVEQTVKLGASAKGNAKITYTSSDKEVKVSSSGKVTIPADYVGEVTITLNSAKTTNYKAASKTVKVTVTESGEAQESEGEERSSGKISASNKTINSKSKKQKVKLGAKARGDAEITYKSSDKKVKVSSSGEVTIPADYAGEVTIKLTSAKTDQYEAASKQVKVTVRPAKAALSAVKASGSKAVQVKWKKVKSATGYLIQYRRSDQKKTKQKEISKQGTTSLKLTKLEKGKNYKVRIRSYKKVSGKKIYSPWSGEKSVKVK